MSEKYKVKLLNVVELDQRSKLVTVEITETKRKITYESTFQYMDGSWIGNNTVITETDLLYALQEQLVLREAEKRLDRYIATP